MGNLILQQAIFLVARLVLGSGVLDKTLVLVTQWADVKIDGAAKRQGVLDAMQVAGLKLSKSAANLAVELAVTLLTRVKS